MTNVTGGKAIFEKSVIEKILGIPFTEDNYVRLLKSGEETFHAIFDSVADAKEIICIEFYIFKDDDTGRKLAELLKEKAKKGIKVYVLYDHFGSIATSGDFWSDMRRAGINIRASHPFKWLSPRNYIHRNHKKLLIIDGRKAFTGGFNIADEYGGYFGKRKKHTWRDTGIYLEGPVAATMFEMFRKSWSAWKGKPIIWDGRTQLGEASLACRQAGLRPVNPVRKLGSAITPPSHLKDIFTLLDNNKHLSGYFSNGVKQGISVIPIFSSSAKGRRKMRKLFFYSINNAKEKIFLTTAYFTPSRRIIIALEDAVKRGVDVRLLLPGKTDIMPVYYAGRYFYKKLLNAGIEIYDYQEKILHAKTAVFDSCWSIVGSANLDFQSLRRNDESNVGIFDNDFSRYMTGAFMEDIQHSIKVDALIWSKRSFYEKILESFFSVFRKRL